MTVDMFRAVYLILLCIAITPFLLASATVAPHWLELILNVACGCAFGGSVYHYRKALRQAGAGWS